MKDFVKLSELFWMYTFVQTTVDNVKITDMMKIQEIKGSFTLGASTLEIDVTVFKWLILQCHYVSN